MARALPVGSELTAVNPAFSALAALGLEEAVVSMGPADGASEADAAEPVASAPPSYEELENAGSAFATPPAILEPGEVVDRPSDVVMLVPTEPADTAPSDPLAALILIPFEFSAATQSSLAIEARPAWSFLDVRAVVEFHTEGLGAPAMGAESAPVFDGAASARPGGGGGGGGSGGGGSGGVLTQFLSGSADGTVGYDILIQFKGTGWTVGLQDAFKNAADYFTTVITDDIGGPGRIGKVIVDDLYVTAEVKTIDGVGNILGQAGPSSVWISSELTAAGQMQFDVADAQDYLNQGLWDDIVTHELMHVLGFGSLWDYGKHQVLVSDNQYTGHFALTAYQEIDSQATFIPVEDLGGPGTAGSHWDEGTLGNDLMTGYIDDDGNPLTIDDNHLSKFSVMSLADLGYAVNYQDYSYDGTPT
jgi:hypothetical protein